jgi:hypothetical protein
MIPGFGFSPMSDNLLFRRNWFPDWVKGRDLPVNRMEMVILKLAKMPADGEVQFQTQTVLRYRGVKFCTCKLILQAYYFTTTAFIVIWIILGKYAASTLSFINRQTVFAATTELVRNLTTWSGCSCSFCQGWYGNTTNLCRTFCASAVLKDRKRRREEGEESSGPWGQPLSPVRVQDFRQLANVPVPLEQMFSQWRGQTPSRRQRPASVWSVRPRQG